MRSVEAFHRLAVETLRKQIAGLRKNSAKRAAATLSQDQGKRRRPRHEARQGFGEAPVVNSSNIETLNSMVNHGTDAWSVLPTW